MVALTDVITFARVDNTQILYKSLPMPFQVGEIMDDRYEVFDTLGKGVFSTVLRARDTAHKNALGKHPEVAVKVSTSHSTHGGMCIDSGCAISGSCVTTQTVSADPWAAAAPVAAHRHGSPFRRCQHPSKPAWAASQHAWRL